MNDLFLSSNAYIPERKVQACLDIVIVGKRYDFAQSMYTPEVVFKTCRGIS